MSIPPDQADEAFLRWANGDEEAARFLRIVSGVARLADDIIDADSANPAADMARLLYETMVSMPSNRFFQSHHSALAPVITNIALTWEATEEWSRSDLEKTRMFAFVLRECSEQLAGTVAVITGGFDHGRHVIREAHAICTASDPETFSDWENE